MANFCPHTALFLTDLTTTLACLFRTQSNLHDLTERDFNNLTNDQPLREVESTSVAIFLAESTGAAPAWAIRQIEAVLRLASKARVGDMGVKPDSKTRGK